MGFLGSMFPFPFVQIWKFFGNHGLRFSFEYSVPLDLKLNLWQIKADSSLILRLSSSETKSIFVALIINSVPIGSQHLNIHHPIAPTSKILAHNLPSFYHFALHTGCSPAGAFSSTFGDFAILAKTFTEKRFYNKPDQSAACLLY